MSPLRPGGIYPRSRGSVSYAILDGQRQAPDKNAWPRSDDQGQASLIAPRYFPPASSPHLSGH
jgi:hypothetical protein